MRALSALLGTGRNLHLFAQRGYCGAGKGRSRLDAALTPLEFHRHSQTPQDQLDGLDVGSDDHQLGLLRLDEVCPMEASSDHFPTC